jgi:hypothetical protein
MKRILFIGIIFLLASLQAKAQIEKVLVETYYISDSLDATDTIDGAVRALPKGSKTYRVYIDMRPGSKLVKLYGAPGHPMKISSTANFFNNVDRPTEYFGYLINKQYFKSNPTLALDSWLTLGLATSLHDGILKDQDHNGSFIDSTQNWGGTAGVPGGLLRNNDTAAGYPITVRDGLQTKTATLSQWSDNGFKDMSNRDTTVFGDTIVGSSFTSTVAFLRQNSGLMGAVPDSNQVLVAQLTTLGDISFEMNAQILDSAGNTINYVAQSTTTPGGDTLICSSLKYPPQCGCRDIRYMEYNPNFACNDESQCFTLKVYGCTDSMACNYDPSANMLLPNFCCYPGYCNDRDIALVCPDIHPRMAMQGFQPNVYPNPAENELTLQLVSGSSAYDEVNYIIYDGLYRVVAEKDFGSVPTNTYFKVDVSQLPQGIYLLKVTAGSSVSIQKFIKN